MPVCQIRAQLWVQQGMKWLLTRANDLVGACPPEAGAPLIHQTASR